MKKIVLIITICIFVFACQGTDSADTVMRQQTEKALANANMEIGMPGITNYQERKLAKMIFELRDKSDLITFAYITSYTGKLLFLGNAIGFGLPYSVQYTNPEKAVRTSGGSLYTLPQADPNGLFMPEGLSATWLMLINPETNQPEPVYIEQEIIVSPFKLH